MSKQFAPRPYQRLIIDHILSRTRAMVWSGMGTGKTVSTLTALRYIRDFFTSRPALVVAPLRVAQSTWPDEIAKWDHLHDLRVSVIVGTAKQRAAALEAKADVYCTNYEQLPWLVEALKGEWPFGVVVCDEATRLKGFRLRSGTKRAKALATVAFKSPHFIELTGTPTANGLIDLWGQAWFIDKGATLGHTMAAYEQAFFYPVKTGGEAYMVKYVPQDGADEKIKRKLQPMTIVVKAEDWFDIAQPIVNDIVVTLPTSAREIYNKMEREFYVCLEDGEELEAVNALAKMGKCLQIASGAVYNEDNSAYAPIHEAKIDALRSVVEEACGAPILVAYQFRHEAQRIMRAFPQAKLLDRDPATIRRWNAGEIPMLLAHPASCGHGLNLQDGGNILVFFGCGYNYEQYAQMCERIGPTRQAQAGHPRPVFIHRIVAEKTLDYAVLQALQGKKDVLDFILDTRR